MPHVAATSILLVGLLLCALVIALQLRGLIAVMHSARWRRRQRQAAQRTTMEVRSRRELSPDLFKLELCRTDGRPLPKALPGQYVVIERDLPGRQPVSRAYSLARWDATPSGYTLIIRREPRGAMSTWLHEHATVGSRWRLSAPRGHFVPGSDPSRPLILVGGGVGITPLRAMADYWVGRDRDVWLWQVARSRAEADGLDEMLAWTLKHARFRYRVLITRPDPAWHAGTGRPDWDTEFASAAVETWNNAEAMLCGPQEFTDSAIDALTRCGVPASRCRVESFGTQAMTSQSTGTAFRVDCSTGMSCEFSGHPTLLHCLEEAGIAVARDCGGGSCGSCAVRLDAGTVRHLLKPQYATPPGHVLACCVIPDSDLHLAL